MINGMLQQNALELNIFLQSSDASGAAYLGPSSQNGSPPIGWVQLGDALIFAHEVGHLFGCEHNREVEGGGSNNDYSYGYLLRGSNMLTIMAYFANGFTNWIPYFSNDDYSIGGVNMGTPRDDNRDSLVMIAKISSIICFSISKRIKYNLKISFYSDIMHVCQQEAASERQIRCGQLWQRDRDLLRWWWRRRRKLWKRVRQ